jgi:Kdo2-lipid IVA lauroyltransferase/acyltransferase
MISRIIKALAFYGVYPILMGLSYLPLSVLYRISNGLCFLLYTVLGYRKKVVRLNLSKSFPEKSAVEVLSLEKKYFQQLSDYIVETIKSFTISKKHILSKGKLVPNPELWALAKEGKNVVISAGHLSNQEFATLFISGIDIFPFTPMGTYHELGNKHFDQLFYNSRARFGAFLYNMKETRLALNNQEKNKPFSFFLLNDQSAPPTKAYWTTFLNQDTGFYKGMAQMAQTHNMPVFYAHQKHISRGFIEYSFTKICLEPNQVSEAEILETHVRLLEKDIQEAPHTWFWSHRRWKHQRP